MPSALNKINDYEWLLQIYPLEQTIYGWELPEPLGMQSVDFM